MSCDNATGGVRSGNARSDSGGAEPTFQSADIRKSQFYGQQNLTRVILDGIHLKSIRNVKHGRRVGSKHRKFKPYGSRSVRIDIRQHW